MVSTGTALHPPYTLKNYADIIATSGVFRWLFNSAVVAAGMTAGTLILSSLAATASRGPSSRAATSCSCSC